MEEDTFAPIKILVGLLYCNLVFRVLFIGNILDALSALSIVNILQLGLWVSFVLDFGAFFGLSISVGVSGCGFPSRFGIMQWGVDREEDKKRT